MLNVEVVMLKALIIGLTARVLDDALWFILLLLILSSFLFFVNHAFLWSLSRMRIATNNVMIFARTTLRKGPRLHHWKKKINAKIEG